MRDAQWQAFAFRAVDELEQAPWVARGDDFAACRADVLHLPIEKLIGHLGLSEIVNACAAAAPVALREFNELHAGNGFEQRARLQRDLLTVAKVTGLVVGDDGFFRVAADVRRL